MILSHVKSLTNQYIHNIILISYSSNGFCSNNGFCWAGLFHCFNLVLLTGRQSSESFVRIKNYLSCIQQKNKKSICQMSIISYHWKKKKYFKDQQYNMLITPHPNTSAHCHYTIWSSSTHSLALLLGVGSKSERSRGRE